MTVAGHAARSASGRRRKACARTACRPAASGSASMTAPIAVVPAVTPSVATVRRVPAHGVRQKCAGAPPARRRPRRAEGSAAAGRAPVDNLHRAQVRHCPAARGGSSRCPGPRPVSASSRTPARRPPAADARRASCRSARPTTIAAGPVGRDGQGVSRAGERLARAGSDRRAPHSVRHQVDECARLPEGAGQVGAAGPPSAGRPAPPSPAGRRTRG